MNSGTLKGFPEKPIKGELLTATANGRIELLPKTNELPSGATAHKILRANPASVGGYFWSNETNSTNWTIKDITSQFVNGGTTQIQPIEFLYGAGLYVFLYYDSLAATQNVVTSPDLITWTSRLTGLTNATFMQYLNNSLFLVYGTNGMLYTSSDGLTWTSRSALGTNQIFHAAYGNNKYVVVGGGGGVTNTGGIATSTDGVTWTRYNATPAVGTVYNNVIWNGTNFIVISSSTATNNMLYSSDGVTWTAGLFCGQATTAQSRNVFLNGTTVYCNQASALYGTTNLTGTTGTKINEWTSGSTGLHNNFSQDIHNIFIDGKYYSTLCGYGIMTESTPLSINKELKIEIIPFANPPSGTAQFKFGEGMQYVMRKRMNNLDIVIGNNNNSRFYLALREIS